MVLALREPCASLCNKDRAQVRFDKSLGERCLKSIVPALSLACALLRYSYNVHLIEPEALKTVRSDLFLVAVR